MFYSVHLSTNIHVFRGQLPKEEKMYEYEEILEKMLSDYVTIEDWNEYKAWFENRPPIITPERFLAGERPTEEELKACTKVDADFVKVAHHVATTLDAEDIIHDLVLTLAYLENQHPEYFG